MATSMTVDRAKPLAVVSAPGATGV